MEAGDAIRLEWELRLRCSIDCGRSEPLRSIYFDRCSRFVEDIKEPSESLHLPKGLPILCASPLSGLIKMHRGILPPPVT